MVLMTMNPAAQILLRLAVSGAAVLRAWIAFRRTEVTQKARTDRLSSAIEGTSPEQRSEIIRACGEMEGGA